MICTWSEYGQVIFTYVTQGLFLNEIGIVHLYTQHCLTCGMFFLVLNDCADAKMDLLRRVFQLLKIIGYLQGDAQAMWHGVKLLPVALTPHGSAGLTQMLHF